MARSWTFSSLVKTTIECLSLFQSTGPTSHATTTVSDDFEKLKGLLPRIKAVLLDAETREIDDESVKFWLKEIKDVALDAEDVLDEYQCHVHRARVENGDIEASEAYRKRKRLRGEEEVMPSASSGSNSALSKISISNSMAERITRIRKRFEEISNDRRCLHLKPEDGERVRGSRSEYPPSTSHMIVKQEICGREHDKAKLINWLFSNTESKFEVLAVVGKGGLGKTTLAQLVYNDQKVSDYFKTRIWICVSEVFNVVRLTRTMVESITKKPCTLSDELSLLQESLREELQGKRVLLVLDDVWDDKKSSWDSLLTPLKVNGAEMVRVIVTTRIDSVAEITQTTENPYRLGHMPEAQCWELFKRHAFCGRDPEEFPYLLDIGKEIVKKCDGLPLSVKSLGGLLQHERDEDEWNDVLQSRLWELKTTEILPALKLSYIRMPSHLKPCFEICSIFPKDFVFTKDELVRLWAANGYIQHNNNDAEKEGCKYFEELHRRSFFDKDYRGYKMHDNIHDLAHYVHVGMDSKMYEHKARHLAIKNESFEFNLDDFGALRTLIVGENIYERLISREQYRLYAYVVQDIMFRRNIKRLTHLRYLAITHTWSVKEFLLLDELRNLICLRYLGLNTEGNLTLRKSIGHLYNLVVLDITCHGIVELPEESFTSLVSLTTIHFTGFSNKQLPALGQLPSLRSLILRRLYVESIGSEFYRGQKKNNKEEHDHLSAAFPSLTSLVFEELWYWKEWGELQEADFPRLQKLEINWCRKLSSLPLLGNISSLSHMSLCECDSLQLSSFPPSLKTLESFEGTKLRLSQQAVGELKKVESLRGKYWARNDQVLEILNNLPMSTRDLNIAGLTNVHNFMEVETKLTSLHRLERLTLKWRNVDDIRLTNSINSLWLIVEDDNGDETNQIENESFFLLEKLQPHTNLKYLVIKNYVGVGYSRWIGDPSFDRLTEIVLKNCKIDQLPTLGQLPSLESIDLRRISGLKIIGDEFCRGTMMNSDHDSLVAFPSLKHLCFHDMYEWEEWYGVLDQDFPQLQKLEINCCKKLSSLPSLGNLSSLSHVSLKECGSLLLSSFPSDLKTLESFSDTKLRFSQQEVGQLKKVESLRGRYWVRNDQVLGILNNLPMSTSDLNIAGLTNVHNVKEAETNLTSLHRLEQLILKWTNGLSNYRNVFILTYTKNPLCVIVEDDGDGTNQIENESFDLLEKLEPHTNLKYLGVESYNGFGYPSWIANPNFDRLAEIFLHNCRNDKLPALGLLPSLKIINLYRIFGLTIIGDEFCRGTMKNLVVAFPSLEYLWFFDMADWKEWSGVLDKDFPHLKMLTIKGCPNLRMDLDSFPRRLLKYQLST